MADITIRALKPQDAHHLAPLLAAYAQAMKRGAPRRPDEFYAELLAADRSAELLGAFAGETLAGFCIFFDLPEATSGFRAGQLEDIYVVPEQRSRGIGRRLIEALRVEGQNRGWTRIRWIIPKPVDAAATGMSSETGLYEEIGSRSEQRLYEVPVDAKV